jgi:ABC-type multidrug transport system fused ATPase/permease subunit
MHIVAKGRTTFIIAHRLSTIKEADSIIVFENGDIVGEGTHTYLYNNCDVYKDMYDSQYKNLNKNL